jgi:hypothetical protein
MGREHWSERVGAETVEMPDLEGSIGIRVLLHG